MTEPIPINDLTFAAELECIRSRRNGHLPTHEELAAYLTDNGVPTEAEDYNHITRRHWKIVSDSTLGSNGAEVVPPILKGEAGFQELTKVCNLLTAFGCRVSRDCGTHVHVGVKDRYEHQIGFFKELLKTYAKFQPILDQLVAPSRRRDNSMVRPIIYTPAMDRATTLRELATLAAANHFSNPNFWDAYQRHGTVEFRQHQGTLNPEKLTNWIRLCLRIVAHAGRNTEPTALTTSTPPRRPILPPEPRFTDNQYDLSTARRIADSELTRYNTRYYGRYWVIGRIGANPRRRGVGFRNWPNYVLGMTVRDYLRAGHPWDQLRWDVVHYHAIDIVDVRNATPLPVVPGSDEDNRRAAAMQEWRTECARRTAAYEAALAAFNRERPRPLPVDRPPTDAAPTTLDGLLDLIGADTAERAFFSERQMELNS